MWLSPPVSVFYPERTNVLISCMSTQTFFPEHFYMLLHINVIFMWPYLFSNLCYSLKLWTSGCFLSYILLLCYYILWIIHIILTIFLLNICFLLFLYKKMLQWAFLLSSIVHMCTRLSFFVSNSLYQDMNSLRAGSLSLILHSTEPDTFYIIGMHTLILEG